MAVAVFNPSEHMMQIGYKDKAKDYLPVQWRLVWFRELCPEGTIETEMVHLDLDRPTEDETKVWNNEKKRMETVVKQAQGFVIFKAIVKDGKGGIAQATKSEKAASFPDFIEKCETGAVGRALAMLGYGTQFTGDELVEHHRIVDSPVEHQNDHRTAQPAQAVNTPATQNNKPENPLRTQQIAVWDRSLELGEWHKGKTAEESTLAFLAFASDVLQVKVASVGHLTKSRLDAIEAYLNGKEQQ